MVPRVPRSLASARRPLQLRVKCSLCRRPSRALEQGSSERSRAAGPLGSQTRPCPALSVLANSAFTLRGGRCRAGGFLVQGQREGCFFRFSSPTASAKTQQSGPFPVAHVENADESISKLTSTCCTIIHKTQSQLCLLKNKSLYWGCGWKEICQNVN